jgi:hypothetical protein
MGRWAGRPLGLHSRRMANGRRRRRIASTLGVQLVRGSFRRALGRHVGGRLSSPPGERSFPAVRRRLDVGAEFRRGPRRTLWLAESRTVVRRLETARGGGSPPGLHLPGAARALIFDRRGTLWVAGSGEGLFRITPSDKADRLVSSGSSTSGCSAAQHARSSRTGTATSGWACRAADSFGCRKAPSGRTCHSRAHTTDGVRALAPPRRQRLGGDGPFLEPADRRSARGPARGRHLCAPYRPCRFTLGADVTPDRPRHGRLRIALCRTPPGIRLERVFSFTSDDRGASGCAATTRACSNGTVAH